MTLSVHEQQSMLVAVGFGSAIVLATHSEAIQREVAGAPLLEHHLDKIPEQAGLYIWEGTLSVDTTGFVGRGALDASVSWQGAFRRASTSDLQLLTPAGAPAADLTESAASSAPARQLSHRELVVLRRAAEDAIHAANPHYAPFVAAVANPLQTLALVDMAMRSLAK